MRPDAPHAPPDQPHDPVLARASAERIVAATRYLVFDSAVGVGLAEAFYASAIAAVVPDAEVDDQIGPFSRRSVAHGGWAWDLARLRSTGPPETGLSLYAADVTDRSTLVQGGPASRTPF